MIARRFSGALFIFVALCAPAGPARAQQTSKQLAVSTPASGSATRTSASAPASTPAPKTPGDETLRTEGEKRFATNCGRCHQSPHKLPPRMMATAIRHMRVRALITDEDMRLILLYMTQ